MTPVEQFFAEYFKERTAFYEKEIELLAPLRQRFFAPDCLYDSRRGMVEHSRAERILSVSQSDGETLVVTTGKHRSGTLPLRYHLQPSGDSWRIHHVEFECPGCHGTGGDTNDHCVICGGKGWK